MAETAATGDIAGAAYMEAGLGRKDDEASGTCRLRPCPGPWAGDGEMSPSSREPDSGGYGAALAVRQQTPVRARSNLMRIVGSLRVCGRLGRLRPIESHGRCPARLAHVLVQGTAVARCSCLILVIVSVRDSPPHMRAVLGLDGSPSSGPTGLVSVFKTTDERTVAATQSWAC